MSGLEDDNASLLDSHNEPYKYEAYRLPFIQPEKKRTYKPDFILRNGIIVETKGLFETADRQKHKFIKEQHPDLDIRFVFSNPNARIGKRSKTTYAKWCNKFGFLYAKKLIPLDWLKEPTNKASIAALKELVGFTVPRRKRASP